MARGTALQWMVARALCEGAPATKGRVAALMGVDVRSLSARSAAEDWQCISWRKGRILSLQREIVALSAMQKGLANDASAPGSAPAGQDAASVGAGAAEPVGRIIPDDLGTPIDGVEPAAAATAGLRAIASEADGIDTVHREGDDAGVAASARSAEPERKPSLDRADPVAVLAGASAFVVRRVAALIDSAERMDGRLDREQIDGLFAFGRMMERWEALARERVQEEETTSDEDLARYVRDVNERIVELAALEARRLLAAGFRPQDDA